MKALVKRRAEEGLWKEDVPLPKIEAHEVLIKTHKTAICGTDVTIYKWTPWAQKNIPVPMVVGHEFIGEIAQLGDAVTGFHVGDVVSGEGHITCGQCRNCRTGKRFLCGNTLGLGVHRHGSFAEYFTLPAENLFPMPKGIDPDVAAIFDPLGNAVHTALSFELIGEDVLIVGAGPIGCMAAAIARHAGAKSVVVTDINDYRLKLASEMGATHTVNVSRDSLADAMKRFGITEGFAVAMEMSGNPAGLNSALEAIAFGGKIALLGILPPNTVIDWDLVIFKGLVVKGIYGREIFSTWYKTSAMLQSGLNIAPVITHRLPIDDFQEGFEVMMSGKSGKVILNW
jgi:threonine 3-dehydrogenase